jgi:hypothetical protein
MLYLLVFLNIQKIKYVDPGTFKDKHPSRIYRHKDSLLKHRNRLQSLAVIGTKIPHCLISRNQGELLINAKATTFHCAITEDVLLFPFHVKEDIYQLEHYLNPI